MLHGSETWPVRKENVVACQRAEMRMVTWMCGVKLKDRLPSKELREREHSFCSRTGCVGMGMCCEKIMMITKLRVQDEEEDQKGPVERLSERIVKHAE